MNRILGQLAAAAFCFVTGVAVAQPVVMRISHQVPPAHHLTRILQDFAADVKARTNGQVDVQLFGSNQLAKAAENYPQVAKGNIEAAASVNFQWGTTIPEMSVTLMPYEMGSLDKIKRFPRSDLRKLLDRKLEEHGVHSLMWLYITRETIVTSGKKPIIDVDDFKGVKIRGLNSLTDHGLIAMGAAPSAMAGSEVYQALQAGVLDAGLTDLSAAYSRKYYEIQKYGTVGPLFTIYFHVYVNPAWWGKLSAANRQAIEAAAAKAEQDAIGITEQTAGAAIGELKGKGMVIHVQTPAEEAAWKKVMQPPVIEAFLKSAPKDGKQAIDLLHKL